MNRPITHYQATITIWRQSCTKLNVKILRLQASSLPKKKEDKEKDESPQIVYHSTLKM